MSSALFRSQPRNSNGLVRRKALVVAAALLFSLSLHLGTYGVVRNRIVSFLELIRDMVAATPRKDAPEVVLVDKHDVAPATDPIRSSNPLTATSELPADILANFRPSAEFTAPSPPAPAVPTILPSPPVPTDDRRLPPPSEVLATDIIAIADSRNPSLALPAPQRDIVPMEYRHLAPDREQAYTPPDILPEPDVGEVLSQTSASLAAAIEAMSIALPAPEAGDRVLMRETITPGILPFSDERTASTLLAEAPETVAPALPLDDRLTIQTSAIRPASDPDHVYFQIDIAPRDDAALKDIPRDIVFVQDTSGSLSYLRLQPCLKAISSALRTLSPTDRFNICVFASGTDFLLPDNWLEPTPAALSRADAFLNGRESAGRTDIFRSMHEVLSLPRDPERAPIAILLTDGVANIGDISGTSAIIGTFSRLNAGVFSVFTVNVNNALGNVYLLDMLSFCDRGGHTATAPDRYRIEKTVSEVVRSIGKPVLKDVQFQFDSKAAAEAFPRLSSNLYRGRPIRLYGRVRADSPTFAFQACGDANGTRYDMLFDIDLRDSSVASGDPSLPTEWATQRMYDLVASYARSEEPDLLSEMRRLGNQFGIPIPHERRLGISPTAKDTP